MSNLVLTDAIIRDAFPEIWKYLEASDVTDLDYNCGNLWLSTVSRIPQKIKDSNIDEKMIKNFAALVSQSVGCNFNPKEHTAYAGSEHFRITCLHESQSRSGISVCIRKFEDGLRISRKEAVDTALLEEDTLHFLDNAARARYSLFFSGYPGHGKTETMKIVASGLPKSDKVVSIEDVGEINYPNINPGANCDEMKVIDGNYRQCMETLLRMNAARVLWGEVRGREAAALLQEMSNGLPVMSTLHMNDARNLPDRMLNMLEDSRDSQRIINQIYKDAGMCVQVRRVQDSAGNVRRFVEQVSIYMRENDENSQILVVENGRLHKDRIPKNVCEQIERETGHGMFDSVEVEAE